ncbi:M36 family metallopeptidase [Hydrocarboniphaga sp.]|uniref:M36 family metallopeptidase n=1 Tax=Hydrocarboniphaga sp. TaxID=2033016 RepID=UPI003D105653
MRIHAGVLLSSVLIAASTAVAAADSTASSVIAHAAYKAPVRAADPERSSYLLNFDTFLKQTASRSLPIPTAGFEGRIQSAQFDRTLGVPTFLWAKTDAAPIAVGALSSTKELLVARARSYLRSEASLLKLTDAMIDDASVANAQYNGKGPAVVRLRQRVNGIEVFHRYLNVLLDKDNRPVAVSGYFATDYTTPSTSFTLSAQQAISKAWGGLGGVLSPLALTLKETRGEYQLFSLLQPLVGSHVFEREPRVRKMYYAANGKLLPAYYVELFSKARVDRSLGAYALMVSAVDGSILHRYNLKANEVAPGATSKPFTYRMYADTTPPYQLFDMPLGNGYTPFPSTNKSATLPRVANPSGPNLVTLSYGPISTKDAWLTDDATATTGNNVDACLDLNDTFIDGILSTPLNTCDPDALGDYRAAPSSDHMFDYTAEPDGDPTTDAAKGGAVISLFYLNNWLHDWWYDHGFDEASGNAQTSNYGRGGEEGDAITAQGQDGSGRNNANMSTPADGSSPTMQQYLFDGPLNGEIRQTLPTPGAPLKFTGASFGPGAFDVTAEAVLASDGGGDSDTDGCGLTIPDPTGLGVIPSLPGTPQLAAAGKIILIDRGSCNFTTKAQFATISGAAGMIVVNNVDADPITMGNADIPVVPVPESPTDMAYQIPSVMIRKDAGDLLKAQLAAGTAVTMHMLRSESTDRDGTLDNQIVGHEFFHYVHHRLTDSSNQQSGAMSEGWGDIDALMISVREDDTKAVGNDHWQGAYGLAGYVVDNFYNGIRRAPYSTDKNKNAFTFKHISDGVATPDGGAGASNSEVHNAGELWANMMWNCYAGILYTANNGTFTEKQTRMKDYIIGGLKMTPADATYTEARDAVIGVAKASGNAIDYAACANGFSAIGAGPAAVSPARDSTDLTGVTEDFTLFEPAPATGGDGGSGGGDGGGNGGGGGGALGGALLLPLAAMAWLRRRRSA